MRSPNETPSPPKDLHTAWAGPSLVVLVYLLLAVWTWRRCGDLLQDFGHQLYIPWRLSEGAVLYRDIFWHFGPLSQQFHAWLFHAFGTSLTTLLVSNLVLILLLVVLVYWLALKVSDRLSATMCAITALCMFCFAHYLDEGNFNFVFPHLHEATHGTIMLVALVPLLSRTAGARSIWAAAGAGLIFGCLMLTKIELALTAVVLTAAAFLLRERSLPLAARLAFACFALLPPALFFLLMCTQMPRTEALSGVLRAWSSLLIIGGRAVSDRYQLQTSGFDDVGGNLWAGLLMSGLCLSLLAVGVLTDRLLVRNRFSCALALSLGILIFAVLFIKQGILPWLELPRGFLAVVFVVMPILRRFRTSSWSPDKSRLCMLWLVLAVMMTLRMILKVRLYHYGFYMALPLTLMLVPTLLYGIPAALARAWGGGVVFRSLALSFLLATMTAHLRFSDFYYERRTEPLGNDSDRFYALSPDFSAESGVAEDLLKYIASISPAPTGLFVIPNGSALNYLLRIPNPTPYPWIDMHALYISGEEVILSALREHSPPLIVLIDTNGGEFGFGLPGDQVVGAKVLRWIRENYRTLMVLRRDGSATSAELLQTAAPATN